MAITSAAFLLCGSSTALALTLRDTGERTTDTRTIHIRGVGAGAFSPDHWTSGPPHLVADIRHPLIEPQPGEFRNVYAPSALARPDGGWYIYYGGWDGLPEGRDSIYVTSTDDFTSFGHRRKVIVPGEFRHVCNVNAQFTPPGLDDPSASSGTRQVNLMCTVYPDANGRNKPALFRLPDPMEMKSPHTATPADIVQVSGYSDYPAADINGMNVLLRDGDRSLLYFGDFCNFGKVNIAEGDAASTSPFRLLGTALDARLAVNDVKKLRDGSGNVWYLMGLHMNRGELYYALSQDPTQFTTATTLLQSAGNADKYMVAIGWVADYASPAGATQVLGVLYGAGESRTLDRNRIFARWIQKRLEFKPAADAGSGVVPQPVGALGPDASVFSMPSDAWTGTMTEVNQGAGDEPGAIAVELEAGRIYQLHEQKTITH